jgi:phosphate transport system substrate-binding protein
MTTRAFFTLFGLTAAFALVGAGCGGDDDGGGGGGTITIDGSSTVGPFATRASEDFRGENPDVRITVGVSGTGGGFERFCAGETDVSDASRTIDEDEVALCEESGVEYVELRVATDALTNIVNSRNDWATCLTVEQLSAIWKPGSTVSNWNQVDPSFPDSPLKLYGPGTDSGTFDYFTDVINGEEGASRTDYSATEDDNVTVTGVAGSEGGIGYFGLSYYEENSDQLKAVEVDGGDGCVAPSAETVQDGTYTPLSRPLFIYPTQELLGRPEGAAFVEYYLDNATSIAEAALFVPLTEEQQATAIDEANALREGTTPTS